MGNKWGAKKTLMSSAPIGAQVSSFRSQHPPAIGAIPSEPFSFVTLAFREAVNRPVFFALSADHCPTTVPTIKSRENNSFTKSS